MWLLLCIMAEAAPVGSLKQVTRVISARGNHPVETITIQIESLPTDKLFSHIIPSHLSDKIAQIVFHQDGKLIPHIRKQDQFLVQLDSSTDLKITVHYLGRYQNLPKVIDSKEDQLLKLHDSSTYYSSYLVKAQSLKIQFEKLVAVSQAGDKFALFKTSQSTQPRTWRPVWAHGRNNHPQVQFYEVERVIEVSQWGNIHIATSYKLTNLGPGLAGEFSRIDYNERTAKNSFRSTSASLPVDTWGLYYRDEVGNITTSHARRTSKAVELEIKTRFMVLGGWNSNFTITYNLPSTNYLQMNRQKNSMRLKNIPWGYEFDNIPTASYRLKVVLPEQSTPNNLSISDHYHLETTFEYLDFEGRPTLVFEQGAALPKGVERMVEIEYWFQGWVWMEWLYCVIAVTGLFMGSVVMNQVSLETLDISYQQDKKII